MRLGPSAERDELGRLTTRRLEASGASGATSDDLAKIRQTNGFPCGPVLCAAEPHVRTPLVDRYLQGSLTGAGIVADGTEDRGVHTAFMTDRRYVGGVKDPAGVQSFTIATHAAESLAHRNEWIERGMPMRRKGHGPHEDAGNVLKEQPFNSEAFLTAEADNTRQLAGAAGKRSHLKSRHDVDVLPTSWPQTPKIASPHDPREGVLAKAVLEGDERRFDSIDTHIAAADAVHRNDPAIYSGRHSDGEETPGRAQRVWGGAAGKSSRTVERLFFGSSDSTNAQGAAHARPAYDRSDPEILRMAAQRASTLPRLSTLRGARPTLMASR